MTTHAHTRANWAAGSRRQAEAAGNRGPVILVARPTIATTVADGRVFRRGNRSHGHDVCAGRSTSDCELGGKFDGNELPDGHQRDDGGRLERALAGHRADGYRKGTTSIPAAGTCRMRSVLPRSRSTRKPAGWHTQGLQGGVGCRNDRESSRTFAGQLHGGGVQGFGVALGQ